MTSSYDTQSKLQGIVAQALSNCLWNALSTYTASDCVSIADLGSSTGLNSCRAFKPALERFRSASAASVVVYHTDLPENHWGILFSTLNTSSESYGTVPDVYPCAIGRSFYSQLFPNNSIDISFASCAFHWLSRPCPAVIESSSSLLSPEVNPQFFSRHSEDLETLLRLRHTELKPAGHLMLNLTNEESDSVLVPLVKVALQMKHEGLLPAGYLDSFPMPFAFGTTEADIAVIRKLPFTIVKMEILPDDFPLYAEYKVTGDAEAYANNYTAFVSGFLDPYLKAMCPGNAELVDTYFERVNEFMRREPQVITQKVIYCHLQKIE